MYFRRPEKEQILVLLDFRAKVNYGFGMPKLDVCCGCILFNAENNDEKHSYFKLLAVKATIVENVKMLSQYLFPVA